MSKKYMICVVLVLLLHGCSRQATENVSLGSHSFRVPKQNLIAVDVNSSTRKAGHLRFVVNPEAPGPEQLVVGVDLNEGTCQPEAKPTSNMLQWACIAARGSRSQSLAPYNPEKVYDDPGNPTQWGYRIPDGKGGYREVAGCYLLSDGSTGRCRSISNYKDLIYSVGFRDDQISRLPSILARVEQLLTSWGNSR